MSPGNLAESKWGPHLENYLDSPEADLDLNNIPDVVDILALVDRFLVSPTSLSFHDLETIWMLLYRRCHIKSLLLPNAVPSCMEPLHTCVARNGPDSNVCTRTTNASYIINAE
jgi:hypothetical protein